MQLKTISKILLVLSIVTTTIYATNTNKKISLQLLWKHQFEFAGFYIAKEKGFYKDVGIDVEIKEFDFGINIIDDVSKGKSTFGLSYPTVILEKSNGADVVLLNAILQSSPHILVSLKSSNIETIKDFKNKKVTSSQHSSSFWRGTTTSCYCKGFGYKS